MQKVVDDKNGLIVHTDVVSEANDLNQMAVQIGGAEAYLGRECKIACADAGYSDTSEIAKLESAGKTVVVPSQSQASHKETGLVRLKRLNLPMMLTRIVTCARRVTG